MHLAERRRSYDWQGGEEPKLMLKMQSRFFRRRELSFPLEHADAVDELLPKYVRVQRDGFKEPRFGEDIEEPPSNVSGDSQ